MIEAIADTHALIWYLFKDSRLSNTARSQIEQATTVGNQIGFSSITLAEIVYLSERNRIPAETCGFKLPSALTGGAWTVEG
jgi:PIN domain nuclease of toxin-antitoxin system